jgi:hypothetical protein
MGTVRSPPRGTGEGSTHILGVPRHLQGQGQAPDVPDAPVVRLPANPAELTLQDILEAHERRAEQSRAENRALQAEIAQLRADFCARPGAPPLKAFGSVHDLPLQFSKSSFDALTP